MQKISKQFGRVVSVEWSEGEVEYRLTRRLATCDRPAVVNVYAYPTYAPDETEGQREAYWEIQRKAQDVFGREVVDSLMWCIHQDAIPGIHAKWLP